MELKKCLNIPKAQFEITCQLRSKQNTFKDNNLIILMRACGLRKKLTILRVIAEKPFQFIGVAEWQKP